RSPPGETHRRASRERTANRGPVVVRASAVLLRRPASQPSRSASNLGLGFVVPVIDRAHQVRITTGEGFRKRSVSKLSGRHRSRRSRPGGRNGRGGTARRETPRAPASFGAPSSSPLPDSGRTRRGSAPRSTTAPVARLAPAPRRQAGSPAAGGSAAVHP